TRGRVGRRRRHTGSRQLRRLGGYGYRRRSLVSDPSTWQAAARANPPTSATGGAPPSAGRGPRTRPSPRDVGLVATTRGAAARAERPPGDGSVPCSTRRELIRSRPSPRAPAP